MKKTFFAGAFLAAAAVVTAPATAAEYVYGSWVSPKHSVMRMAMPGFFKSIEQDTKGAIKWKLVAGGALVNLKGTLPGIRDSLVDGGFTIAPFAPSNLPSTNLIFNTQIFGDDTVAASGAMNEMVLIQCPTCLAEAKKNNLIQLGGYATTPYLLMCRRSVTKVSDLKGLKVRSSGGGVSVMKMAGATPVAMSPAAATQALQRGAVDCVHGAMSWLRSYGYEDVVKSVLDYPLGMGGPAMHLSLNRKRLKAMTKEQQQAHIDAAPMAVAAATIDAYIENDKKIKKRAEGKGVKFVKGGDSFDKLVADRLKNQRIQNIELAKKFNLKNGEELLTKFDEVVAKWQKLSKDINGDKDKFAAALKREIYDKIKPEDL